jgi:hypothetical protein
MVDVGVDGQHEVEAADVERERRAIPRQRFGPTLERAAIGQEAQAPDLDQEAGTDDCACRPEKRDPHGDAFYVHANSRIRIAVVQACTIALAAPVSEC